MKYRFTKQAQLEISDEDEWWRSNRLAAPNLFREELSAAVEHVASHPDLGKAYEESTRRRIRYVILPRSRNKLYYWSSDEEVVFVSLWGARRGRDPKL